MTTGKGEMTMTRRLRSYAGSESGFALLSAMIFLVVLLLVGASLVQTSSQELQTASRVRKESRALNLAEAGIDHAAWKLYYAPSTPLPATWTRTDLPTGTFTVTATQYVGATGPMPNTVVLQSTGVAQGWTSQLKVVGRFLQNPGTNNPIFDQALFSDAELRIGGTADIKGNVHANANIKFNGSPKVDGDVSAVGSITNKGTVTGTRTPNAPRVPMPTIDLAYYRSIATTVINGNYNFNGNATLDGVTFIAGDCSINSTFSGKGVIVCSGNVTINGSARLQSLENDEMAIVAAGSVRCNGNCRIEGFVYTHNLDVPAGFTGNGTADIYGGVAADVINISGTLLLEYREPTLPLPGDTSAPAQFASISWRRVR
jgi:cytoskeletal protein CcmA (bactofilin family)/type II secretory pathway pseudopilin PulG